MGERRGEQPEPSPKPVTRVPHLVGLEPPVGRTDISPRR